VVSLSIANAELQLGMHLPQAYQSRSTPLLRQEPLLKFRPTYDPDV
jgi:hypothetical protein